MRLILPVIVMALLGASPVAAKPALVAANPAEGTVVAKLSRISLRFNEALVAAQSGFELVMTAMPGMSDHQPMRMNGIRPALSADGQELSADLPRGLPAGSYAVNWHTAGVDGQRAAGAVRFSVP